MASRSNWLPTQALAGIDRVSVACVALFTVIALTLGTTHGDAIGKTAVVLPCCQCVAVPVTVTVTTPPCGPLAGTTDAMPAPDGVTVKANGKFVPPELRMP